MLAMRVTVDLFSGRPNPTFELEPDEAERIRRLLGSLPPAPEGATPAEPPALGYRGLHVQGNDLGGVYVYGPSVVDAGGARFDTDRRLERLLLDSARRHLGPDALPEDWFSR